MRNKVTLLVFLTGFWLLLSGYYQPLMLGFMVFSVLVVMFFVQRMKSYYFEINPFTRVRKIGLFLVWFIGEIVKSNWVVAKAIWLGTPIRPVTREIKCTQKTRAGRVLYANAIILTPGTLSMEIDEENETILVHALTDDMLDELEEGEMDRRITQMEAS